MAYDAHDFDHSGHGHHHVLDKKMLLRVFGGLIFLTMLTVVLGLMERSGALHLGALSVPVALAIASVKAYLVAAFFMGLREDGGSNALAFISSIAFLLVFVSFTYLDTGFRDVVQGTGACLPDRRAEPRHLGRQRAPGRDPELVRIAARARPARHAPAARRHGLEQLLGAPPCVWTLVPARADLPLARAAA